MSTIVERMDKIEEEYKSQLLYKLQINAGVQGVIHNLSKTASFLDKQDIEGEFWHGVLKALPKVKNIGNPIAHLIQMGVWQVKSAIIVMTSNIGSQYIQKMETIGFSNNESGSEYTQVKERVTGALKEFFKPEFLNRLDETIIFDVLSKDEIKQIVGLQVNALAKRLLEKEIILEVTDEAVSLIGDKSYDPHYGARPIKRYMQTHILNSIAALMLSKKFAKGGIARIFVNKKGEIEVEALKPKKIPSPLTHKEIVTKK
jgi:hypothetical protein